MFQSSVENFMASNSYLHLLIAHIAIYTQLEALDSIRNALRCSERHPWCAILMIDALTGGKADTPGTQMF